MKKLFLTAVIASCTLAASAQFMVVTSYDGDKDGLEQITANWGIGYAISDAITIGFANGDDDNYEMFARYNVGMVDGMYASFQTPLENASDNMSIGMGYSVNVWNALYAEPNVTYQLSDQGDGDRMNFTLGLAVRF